MASCIDTLPPSRPAAEFVLGRNRQCGHETTDACIYIYIKRSMSGGRTYRPTKQQCQQQQDPTYATPRHSRHSPTPPRSWNLCMLAGTGASLARSSRWTSSPGSCCTSATRMAASCPSPSTPTTTGPWSTTSAGRATRSPCCTANSAIS